MQREKYQGVIDQLLSKNKIFVIEKPRTKGQSTMDNPILQKIYDSCDFWERKVNKSIACMD